MNEPRRTTPEARRAKRTWERWMPYCVVAGTVFVCVPMLIYPMGKDQAFYAYAGWMLREGGIPGVDWWAQTPPGMACLNALSQIVFGHTSMAIRGFDLLWSVATAASLAALGMSMRAPLLGLVAGLAWCWSYAANYNYFHSAQVDGFLTLPAVGMLLCAQRGCHDRRPRWWIAVGALLSQAFLVKYIALALLLAPLFALWASRRTVGIGRGVLTPLLWTFGGFVASAAPWIVWLAATGSLPHLIDAQRSSLVGYAATSLSFGFMPATLAWFFNKHLALLAAAGFGLWAIAGADRVERALVVGWLMAAALGFVAQTKGFIYHSLPLLGPLALLAGEAVARGSRTQRIALVVTLFLTVPTQIPGFRNWLAGVHDLVQVARTSATPEDLWNQGRPVGSGFMTANLKLAEILRAETSSRDTVYVWGFEPLVYFHARRRSPTRFVSNTQLVAVWHDPAWREELVSDLRTRRPSHIAVVHGDASPWVTGTNRDSAETLEEFTALKDLLERDYRLTFRGPPFSVYRRHDWVDFKRYRPPTDPLGFRFPGNP